MKVELDFECMREYDENAETRELFFLAVSVPSSTAGRNVMMAVTDELMAILARQQDMLRAIKMEPLPECAAMMVTNEPGRVATEAINDLMQSFNGALVDASKSSRAGTGSFLATSYAAFDEARRAEEEKKAEEGNGNAHPSDETG